MKKTTEEKKKRVRQPDVFPGVYERPSPTKIWEGKPDVAFYIYYRDGDGKLKGEKVGWLSEGYSLKLAAQVRGDRIRAVRHSEELPHEKPKAPYFKDVVKQYLKWKQANKTRGTASDLSRIRLHLLPRFGEKRLSAISTFDLEKMKIELSREGYAPATIRHAVILFRAIWNKAIQWDLHSGVNPVKGVDLPELNNARERFLSVSEAEDLLKGLIARSEKLHDMAVISLHCGLRAGEIFALRGYDLDMVNGLINVANPKNRTPRKVPMTARVKAILETRVPKDRGGFVFPEKRHQGQAVWVSKVFADVADPLFNEGITDRRQRVTFHSLRHTFASHLAIQGESLLVIKELLGHKDLSMVQRYAHLSPDTRRSAVERLAANYQQETQRPKKGAHNVTKA